MLRLIWQRGHSILLVETVGLEETSIHKKTKYNLLKILKNKTKKIIDVQKLKGQAFAGRQMTKLIRKSVPRTLDLIGFVTQ
jgi:hypothetical protein